MVNDARFDEKIKLLKMRWKDIVLPIVFMIGFGFFSEWRL